MCLITYSLAMRIYHSLSVVFILTVCLQYVSAETELQSPCEPGKKKEQYTGVIPEAVGDNVTCVSVVNLNVSYMSSAFSTYRFTHASWRQIKSLTLLCEEHPTFESYFSLPQFSFIFLNITSLKIACKGLNMIHEFTLKGLENLLSLDLSDCHDLLVPYVELALRLKDLNNLEVLKLRRVGIFGHVAQVFSNSFFSALKHKPIKHLDLSETEQATMNAVSFSRFLPHLETLNISNAGYLPMNFMLAYYLPQSVGPAVTFMKLINVDVSYPIFPDELLNPRNSINQIVKESYRPPLNLKTIIARGFATKSFSTALRASTNSSSVCLDVLFLHANVTWSIGCLVKTESGIPLEVLNFAENNVEHIDVSLLMYAYNLKILNISRNKLHLMKWGRLGSMFVNTTKLTELYISYNQLMHIPQYLFKSTPMVTVIDMSFNKIEAVTFRIGHLEHLRILKINNNKIKTLEHSFRDQIDKLSSLQQNITTCQGLPSSRDFLSTCDLAAPLTVDLSSNQFTCLCDNKDFVRWLIMKSNSGDLGFQNEVPHTLTCDLDGETERIDGDIMLKIDKFCKRPLIIGVVCAAASCFTLIGTIIVVIFIRRRKEMARQKFINGILRHYRDKDGENWNRYPVYLVFNTDDERFVKENILGEMNRRVQKLLDTNRKCVATEDYTVRLGFYEVEELIRSVEMCEVIVFCISEKFCRCVWCKEQLQIVRNQQKPFVLMFLDDMNENDMPNILKQCYQNISRSRWVRKAHGELKLEPNWGKVCESIVVLMDPELKQ